MPSIWITSNPRPERSRAIHSFSRAADSATKRRFRQTRAVGRRHVTFGQAHRTFELARRDVDQHLVHGPLTEPVFRHRTFPPGKSLLLAIEATKARAFNRHLAAVKANLAFRLAPAMRRSVLAARVSRGARRSRVVFHHLGKCLDSRGKAETFETRRHIRQRFDLDRSRRNRGGCDKPVHGVAFLSWNQHPEPTSSRRATPLLLFQQSPGQAHERCVSHIPSTRYANE